MHEVYQQPPFSFTTTYSQPPLAAWLIPIFNLGDLPRSFPWRVAVQSACL